MGQGGNPLNDGRIVFREHDERQVTALQVLPGLSSLLQMFGESLSGNDP